MRPILVVSGRTTPQSDSLYGGPPRFADGAAEHKFWMSYQTTSTPVAAAHDPDWPPSRVVAVEQQEMKWAQSQLQRSYRQHSQTVSEIRSEASLSVLTCQVASIEVTEVTEVPPEAGRGPHEETLVLRPAFVRWIVLPGELSLTHGLAPVTRLFPRGEGVKTALLDELMASTATPSVTNLTVQRWHF